MILLGTQDDDRGPGYKTCTARLLVKDSRLSVFTARMAACKPADGGGNDWGGPAGSVRAREGASSPIRDALGVVGERSERGPEAEEARKADQAGRLIGSARRALREERVEFLETAEGRE